MSEIILSHQAPILPVHDIELTLDYYQHKLGFENIWKWDDPVTIASASRDDLTMLFSVDPEQAFRSTGMDIMIFLTGVEHLFKEYQSRGISFSAQLEIKPWGLQEFCVLDINGYYLRFAESK